MSHTEGKETGDQIAVSTRPDGRDRSMPFSNKTWLVVLAIFLAAFSLRLVNLGGRSLWVDEGATAIIAQGSIDEIGDAGSEQKHPPGYYVFIHFTSRISDSEFGLRLPSAIASSLAAVVTYLVARRLIGHQFGLMAAAILAVSPLDLWYAQEARQPVFAGLAVIVAAWGLVRGGKIGLAFSAATLTLGLYMDYVTAIGWAAVGGMSAVLWLRNERRKVIEWVLVTGVAALAFGPFEGPRFIEGFQVLLGDRGAGIWYGDIFGSNPITANPIGLLLVGAGLTAAVLLVGDRLTRHRRRGTVWATLIVLGFAIGSALTPIPRAYSVKKIIVVGWPLLALAVAYLILTRITPPVRLKILVSVLVLSAAASIGSLFVPKDDWRGATAYVNSHAEAGDAVWVGPDPWAADAYLYYKGEIPVHYNQKPDGELRNVEDVWLITYRRPQDDPPALEVEEWFNSNWHLSEEASFYRLAVRKYTR